MSSQIISIRSIALAVPLLVWGVGIGAPMNPARADDCLTAPNSATPKGSHWYYHTDRAKGRKCWFLRALDPPAQRTAAQGASAAAPATHASAIEKPATASGDSTPPLPPPKPQPAPISSATMHEPVQQSVQGNAAPSIPEAPAPLANASSQTSTQAAAVAPAATIVWPDPPAVATVKAQQPDLVPSDAHADSVPPPVDARKPIDPGDTARSGASTAHAVKTAASPAAPLVEILLTVALGLAAAGLLYRFLLKLAARRGRRVIIDHPEADWIDDRHEHELRADRQPHGSVNAREQFIDDLHLSLVPAASDYPARRPLRTDEARQNNASREDNAFQMTDEVREHENRLAQLIRDLDQLLQSRKEA